MIPTVYLSSLFSHVTICSQIDSVMGGFIKVPNNHYEVDEGVDPPSPWTTTHYPSKVIYVHEFSIATGDY